VSKVSGSDDTPYDTRTHNTVNEITALDPQGGVGSFNLDWGEGSEQEREYDAGDSAWEPRRQFVYGGTYIDEHLIFDKDTDGDGVCDDARYFYAQQANWNVVAITDSSGDLAEKVKYDPYGQATVYVEEGKSASGNPYLFQGRRWDDEVGLYYFRNRVMNSVLGRFLQKDAFWTGLLTGEGLNKYLLAVGAPTVWTDPNGEYATKVISGSTSAVREFFPHEAYDAECFIVSWHVGIKVLYVRCMPLRALGCRNIPCSRHHPFWWPREEAWDDIGLCPGERAGWQKCCFTHELIGIKARGIWMWKYAVSSMKLWGFTEDPAKATCAIQLHIVLFQLYKASWGYCLSIEI